MQTYTYESLTPLYACRDNSDAKIRLLKLSPGLPDEPIECQLSVFRLTEVANNKVYESLSYCWGTEDADMCIGMGCTPCKDGKTILNVRPNLYEALRVLRLRDRARTLWIDAICINQIDDKEKSAQVSLMRQIYEGAMRTLIWLGSCTPDTAPVMLFLRTLKTAWDKCDGNVAKIAKLTDDDLEQLGLPSARDVFESDKPKRLLNMLELPWFERAWIVQEVTVSMNAQVYWGSECLDWRDLITAICFASRAELPGVMYGAYQRVVTIADEDFLYRHERSKLLPALLRHRSCKVTEPLDKIYAFLGLANGNNPSIPLEVDYNQDLPVAYTSFAREIARHDRSLDILSMPARPHGRKPSPRIPGLPTWAPDWGISFQMGSTRPRYVHRPDQRIYAEAMSLANTEESGSRVSKAFSAACTSSYMPTDERNDSSLVVQGHRLDSISSHNASIPFADRSTFPNISGPPVYLDWERSIGLNASLPSTPVPKYVTGEELLDAFCQTILVGNVAPTESMSDLRKEYCAWSKYHRDPKNRRSYRMSQLASSFHLYRNVPESFRKRLQAAIFRTFVQTEKRYMGLVSGKVMTGDQIWLLKGSKVPILLRKRQGGEEFEVVGDAYIHGVMYGEAFEEEKCRDIVLL